MGVKRGYKQTDIGIVPSNWNVVRIGDVFRVLRSGSNTRDELTTFGEVKYLHYGDIHTRWRYFLDMSREDIPYIDLDRVEHLPNVQNGDLVIADASEDNEGLGASIEVRNVDQQRVVAGLHTFLLRGDARHLADGFKGYLQAFHWFRNSVVRTATGVSVYGLSRESLLSIKLPLPPLAEQRAIAEVLSDMDAQIAALDALIAKKRDIKQGAMQELLTGRRRLPGFSGAWETRRLGEISTITMGQSPISSYYNHQELGLPFIQGNADVVERKAVARIYTTEVTKRGSVNDIIMTVRAPVGLVGKLLFDVCLGRGVCSISFPNNYLYHYLVAQEDQWSQFSTGSTFDAANSESIRAFPVYLTSNAREQEAIAAVLDDIDAEISQLEIQRHKTADLKQAMMQELLTGKTRLIQAITEADR